MQITDRCRNYLAKMESSIQGSGGSTAMYNKAVVARRGFDLTEDQAFEILMADNLATSLPPWSEAEVRHKIRSTEKSNMPGGHLLRDDDHRAARPTPRTAPAAVVESDDIKAARDRRNWPTMTLATLEDCEAIAALRGLSVKAPLYVAGDRRLLTGEYEGHRCFFIIDRPGGKFCQARRFDGGLLPTASGPKKTKSLSGSRGSWICHTGFPDGAPVIVAEGVISILEMIEIEIRADDYRRNHDIHPSWSPVAMVAATICGSRLHADDIALMRGRRVRILSDSGKAGEDFAAITTATLRAAGCTVDACPPPLGCGDLGDTLRTVPAGDECWNQILTF